MTGSSRRPARGAWPAFLRTLFRVSTFVADQERLSAGAAIDQLRLALDGNVWYLDGGWQTMVDGLRDRAIEAGAEIRTGARAESVRSEEGGVSVQLAGGESAARPRGGAGRRAGRGRRPARTPGG